MSQTEWLITSQAYNKFDQYKQTFILHDSIFANSEKEAEQSFRVKYNTDHHIVEIFSVSPICLKYGIDN